MDSESTMLVNMDYSDFQRTQTNKYQDSGPVKAVNSE